MNYLYGITDSQLMPGELLIRGVTAALKGGCQWVQYRDKSLNKTQRLADATRLLKLCHDYNAKLFINDDVQLAKDIGADGVHLGQDDDSPLAARRLLGDKAIIGITCHASLALAQQAINAGANYVAFGRFFRSNTKPDAPPAPLSLLTEARALLGNTPIIAIGGITLENSAIVRAAGANIIAVSHSLFAAPDITQQAQAFQRALRQVDNS